MVGEGIRPEAMEGEVLTEVMEDQEWLLMVEEGQWTGHHQVMATAVRSRPWVVEAIEVPMATDGSNLLQDMAEDLHQAHLQHLGDMADSRHQDRLQLLEATVGSIHQVHLQLPEFTADSHHQVRFQRREVMLGGLLLVHLPHLGVTQPMDLEDHRLAPRNRRSIVDLSHHRLLYQFSILALAQLDRLLKWTHILVVHSDLRPYINRCNYAIATATSKGSSDSSKGKNTGILR